MINRKWVQTKKTQLYTSIGSTATSILLKNAFKLDGSLLDMEDDFGAIGFMTLEPGGLKEEIISFTGLSYNLSGTILTLSGVTRGRKGEYPYTTGGVAYGHSANRVAIFTNNPQHYEGFANKYNEETITEVWTFTETERPKLDVDRDALLAEEFITLGQANRLIQATYLPPQIVASDSGTTGTSQAASLTISHTIPATIENGGTFVVINTEENKTVSTVTLGGVALTRVATKTRVTGNIRVEIWRLIAPVSGTANLVITPSANAYITGHVISLSNVNQTTPEDALSTGADGSGTAVADSITTTTQGAVILMGVGTANDPTTFTPTAPLAEQEVNSATTNRPLSSSVRSTTTAGAYALAYTIAPSTNWATKAIAIRGIASINDNTVKATSADTTPDYLDDKFEIVSADSSVTITKTIQNPAGNEKISYDLSAVGGGGGNTITLTAGEDLTAGNTVGYASNINDTAMKAVWAYRTNTYQPPLVTDETTYTGIRGICEIDTDKYVVLVTNNQSGINLPTRAMVVTLDRDTNTWSFGLPVTFDRLGNNGISIAKAGTDKFLVAYFTDNVNYVVVAQVGTVSGTTISFGTQDSYPSTDNATTVDLVQLDTDRLAMLVSGATVGSACDLFEVTISGTVVTIGAGGVSAFSPVNSRIGVITKIATDKVAIMYNTNLKIATVSSGTWTLGSATTLPLSMVTSLNYGAIGIVSTATDTVWLLSGLKYAYYTVSGTTTTQVASGSYTDASSQCSTLLTDGTNVFLFAQSSDADLSGIAKLTVNGASIDRSAFGVLFNMGSAYVQAIAMPLIKNNTISGTNYYGIVNYLVSTGSRTITLDYHIQGMTPGFIGIAQATTARGASVSVKIAGVDSNQTGLVAGALYNPLQGGIVNTGTQSFDTMTAQNATDLNI